MRALSLCEIERFVVKQEWPAHPILSHAACTCLGVYQHSIRLILICISWFGLSAHAKISGQVPKINFATNLKDN